MTQSVILNTKFSAYKQITISDDGKWVNWSAILI